MITIKSYNIPQQSRNGRIYLNNTSTIGAGAGSATPDLSNYLQLSASTIQEIYTPIYTANVTGTTICATTQLRSPIVCASTCFAGSGAGLTGTAPNLTSQYALSLSTTGELGGGIVEAYYDGQQQIILTNANNAIVVDYANCAGNVNFANCSTTATNANCLGGIAAANYAKLSGNTFTGNITAPIICASTCFSGNGAGLTGTAPNLTAGAASIANNSTCLNGFPASCYAGSIHGHGYIGSGGNIGSASGCVVVTTTNGVLTASSPASITVGCASCATSAGTLDGCSAANFAKCGNITATQADTITVPAGLYNIEGTALTGLPGSYNYLISLGDYSGGGYRTQLATSYQSDLPANLYLRKSDGATWGTWYKMYHENNSNNISTNWTANVLTANSGNFGSQVNAGSNGGNGGYISTGNHGGTGNAAYFPSGLWANGANSWIYGDIAFSGLLHDNNSTKWSINSTNGDATFAGTACLKGKIYACGITQNEHNHALYYNNLTGQITYSTIPIFVGSGSTKYLITTDTTTTLGFGAGVTPSNTSIGVCAAPFSTNTSFSTAVGRYSLYSLTTGADNVAVGSNAGYSINAGCYNVAVGSNAGYSINAGNCNVNIGFAAGNYLCGSNNTIVGAFAGYCNSTTYCGSNNILIGYYAGSCAGSINDKLIIHNNKATASTPLICGDFAAASLKVNGTICGTSTIYATTISAGAGNFGNSSYPLTISNSSASASYPVIQTCHTLTSGTLSVLQHYNNGNAGGYIRSCVSTGVLSFVSGSDCRLKCDIQPNTCCALSIVNSIPVYDYKFKNDSGGTCTTGMLAQDVKKVWLPAIAENTGMKDSEGNDMLGLSKEELIVVYHKAIQELSAEIQQLKAKIG